MKRENWETKIVRERFIIKGRRFHCEATLKNGLHVTIKPLSSKNPVLLRVMNTSAAALRRLLNIRLSSDYYVAAFPLKTSPAHLVFRKNHLEDVLYGLTWGKQPQNCWCHGWCYKFLYDKRVFPRETLGWDALWSAIIKNSSPSVEAVLLDQDAVLRETH